MKPSNFNQRQLPRTLDNYVGVEFEFLSLKPRQELVDILNKLELQPYVNLGQDVSVQPRHDDPVISGNEDEWDNAHRAMASDADSLAYRIELFGDGVSFSDITRKETLKTLDRLKANLLKSMDMKYVQTQEAFGYELRLLVKQKEVTTILAKLQPFFKEAKAYANKTCGLHVHLDMRNRNVEQCFKRLYDKQSFLYAQCAKHRADSAYATKVDRHTTVGGTGHYHGINAGDAYRKLKTIEVRIKEGTTDCTDVRRWVNTLLNIVEGNEVGIKRKKKPSVKKRKTA